MYALTSILSKRCFQGGVDSLRSVSEGLGARALVDSGCVQSYGVIGSKTLASLESKFKAIGRLFSKELQATGNSYLFGGGQAKTVRTIECTVTTVTDVKSDGVGNIPKRGTIHVDVVEGWLPFLLGSLGQEILRVIPSYVHQCLLRDDGGRLVSVRDSWHNGNVVLPLIASRTPRKQPRQAARSSTLIGPEMPMSQRSASPKAAVKRARSTVTSAAFPSTQFSTNGEHTDAIKREDDAATCEKVLAASGACRRLVGTTGSRDDEHVGCPKRTSCPREPELEFPNKKRPCVAAAAGVLEPCVAAEAVDQKAAQKKPYVLTVTDAQIMKVHEASHRAPEQCVQALLKSVSSHDRRMFRAQIAAFRRRVHRLIALCSSCARHGHRKTPGSAIFRPVQEFNQTVVFDLMDIYTVPHAQTYVNHMNIPDAASLRARRLLYMGLRRKKS